MSAISQQIQVLIDGNMVTLDVDANLFGTGTVAARPASGGAAGDIYFVQDAPLYRYDVWDGSAWQQFQANPVGATGGGAHGDLLYRAVSTWEVVPVSGATQYQVLQTNGSGAAPTWSTTKVYPDSATDPVSPSPADGDLYYNTAIDMRMTYDAARAKWLSVAESTFHFAGIGATGVGAYFLFQQGFSYSDTTGRRAEFNGTIISLTYTRTDTDSATFEVTEDGTARATLASTAISGTDTTLNGDFSSGGILGVRNQAGGSVVNNAAGWVRIRWRV